MGPSCFGGYKIQGLWRLDPQWMNGEEKRETESMKGDKVEGNATLFALPLVHMSVATER